MRGPYQGFNENESVPAKYEARTFGIFISITSCSFHHLNYLKQSHLDGEVTRLPTKFTRVSNATLRDQGIAVNFVNTIQPAEFLISRNTFTDTYMSYPCIKTLNETEGGYEQLQDALNATSAFTQLHHLVNICEVTFSLVIISENTFKNVSTSGPLLHLEETLARYDSVFIVARNTFDMVLGYINSNLVTVMRDTSFFYDGIYPPVNDLNPDYPNWDMYEGYAREPLIKSLYGAQILILNNTASNVCGCPQVDAGAFLIAYRYMRRYAFGEYLGYERSHSDYGLASFG